MTFFQEKIKSHFKFPTYYNDGSPVSPEEYLLMKDYFIEKYGGLSVDIPTLGYWKESGVVYKDETIEYVVFIEKTKFENEVESDLPNEIEQFKKRFKHLDILCYYHSVVST